MSQKDYLIIKNQDNIKGEIKNTEKTEPNEELSSKQRELNRSEFFGPTENRRSVF